MSESGKPSLREANDNPWYCLATLYGEQPAEDWDEELAARNRIAWNRWAATKAELSDERRKELVEKGIAESDLRPFKPAEEEAFLAAFAARTDGKFDPPDPADLADFSKTRFKQRVDFIGFWFPGGTNFTSAAFSGPALFDSAAFSGLAFFDAAAFSGDADFVNAKFKTRTVFAGARFETRVPDFRGAKLHEATEWHGVTWPKPPGDKEAAQDQVYAYERLKLEMERLKKHGDEQFFFKKELRARRGLTQIRSGAWLLNFLYEASCDYGQSIALPLLWLVVLFGVGSALFMWLPVLDAMPMDASRAMALSFANMLPLLPSSREIIANAFMDNLSSGAHVIGVVQSLAGSVLLFAVALALRNRFRMR